MEEFTPLEVSAWIKKLGPTFKDTIIPLGLSCISFYHQIKVNEHFHCAAIEFWIPTWNILHFNGVELCPILEEFGAIMGEPDLGSIITPTFEDLSDMAH